MPVPKTMQAAVVEKFGEPLVVREVPVPSPGPGQALVEIFASGVCHTDLHAAEGDWPVKPTLPFTPGHEGAGTVVALGPGVTHLKLGDRVGIAWLHSACGHCRFCLSGWETLCLKQKNSGYSVNGSFAQYALAQADYLGRIPESLSFVDAAPILCAGVTTYKGLKETETRPGEWVVIIRGSIVGTRLDLEEALTFAADGKVKATIETQPLESINEVFARLKSGQVNGRVVLQIGEPAAMTKTP